jgi:hypothetical protein
MVGVGSDVGSDVSKLPARELTLGELLTDALGSGETIGTLSVVDGVGVALAVSVSVSVSDLVDEGEGLGEADSLPVGLALTSTCSPRSHGAGMSINEFNVESVLGVVARGNAWAWPMGATNRATDANIAVAPAPRPVLIDPNRIPQAPDNTSIRAVRWTPEISRL